jgi:hypothetical protein
MVVVATAIRLFWLYAIPIVACRHGKTYLNARFTLNGSCLRQDMFLGFRLW